MEKILRSKLLTCILILVLASTILVFAGDVIVKQGDLAVADDLSVGHNLTVAGSLNMTSNSTIYGYPDAYIHYLTVDYYADFYELHVGESIHVQHNISTSTLSAQKIYTPNPIDPPGVLYDQQTRQEISYSAKAVVPVNKQGGALLFFNKDRKKLEIYVQSEGKFYDLQGNLLHTMPTIEVVTDYKTIYYLDFLTGEVMSRQELVCDKYIIKKGYRLDTKTGHFINKASGEIVPKETAVELEEGS